MITITKFEISGDRLSIAASMNVEAGDTITSIKMWSEENYKTPTLGVDLTSLLDGSSESENITISAFIAGETSFDGIYFLEITSSNSADPKGMVAAFAPGRFYTMMAGLLANVDLSCLNCSGNMQNALLIDMYIQAIINAIRIGRFRDAIEFLRKIQTYTDQECDECTDITQSVSTAGNIVSVGVVDCQLENMD